MNICKRALGIALRHPLYLVIYIGFLSAMGVALMGEATVGASDPRSHPYGRASPSSTATSRR